MAVYTATYIDNTLVTTETVGNEGVIVNSPTYFDFNDFMDYLNYNRAEVIKITVYSNSYKQSIEPFNITKNTEVYGVGETEVLHPLPLTFLKQNVGSIDLKDYGISNQNSIIYKLLAGESIFVDITYKEVVDSDFDDMLEPIEGADYLENLKQPEMEVKEENKNSDNLKDDYKPLSPFRVFTFHFVNVLKDKKNG